MSVDAHCHIDLHPNPREVFERLIADGVQTVAVTTTPAAFTGSSRFMDVFKGIYPAVGFHPEVVGQRPSDIKLMRPIIERVQWVGEIGIDGSKRFANTYEKQRIAFERILTECQLVGGRNLSIHSRNATDEVLDCLERHPGAGVAVLHWFSGTKRQLRRAIELDCYFSVNGEMMGTTKGQDFLLDIPIDRILTESDAPFASRSSKQSIASRLNDCEQVIAKVLTTSQAKVVASIRANFDRITSPLRLPADSE